MRISHAKNNKVGAHESFLFSRFLIGCLRMGVNPDKYECKQNVRQICDVFVSDWLDFLIHIHYTW